MVRIQYEVDQIEAQKKFLLKARKMERNLKREVGRLNRIFTNYIAEFSDSSAENADPKAGLSEKAVRKNLKKILRLFGVDEEKIKDLAQINFEDLACNLKDVINHNYGALKMGWKEFLKKRIMQKLGIGLKATLTDTQGFNLGKRGARFKGNHPVYLYIKEFKKMMAEGQFQLKANQPLRIMMKEFSTVYEVKTREDPHFKFDIAQFT